MRNFPLMIALIQSRSAPTEIVVRLSLSLRVNVETCVYEAMTLVTPVWSLMAGGWFPVSGKRKEAQGRFDHGRQVARDAAFSAPTATDAARSVRTASGQPGFAGSAGRWRYR